MLRHAGILCSIFQGLPLYADQKNARGNYDRSIGYRERCHLPFHGFNLSQISRATRQPILLRILSSRGPTAASYRGSESFSMVPWSLISPKRLNVASVIDSPTSCEVTCTSQSEQCSANRKRSISSLTQSIFDRFVFHLSREVSVFP